MFLKMVFGLLATGLMIGTQIASSVSQQQQNDRQMEMGKQQQIAELEDRRKQREFERKQTEEAYAKQQEILERQKKAAEEQNKWRYATPTDATGQYNDPYSVTYSSEYIPPNFFQ